MANVAISALPAVTSLGTSDVVPCVASGTTSKITRANLAGTLGIVPAGAMLPYGGSSVPSGWLMCDGSAVSRTTYAALFTAIGTSFGSGNGTSTFNVPNLQGRAAVGIGGGSFNSIGQTIGDEQVALDQSQLPAVTLSSSTSSYVSSGSLTAVSVDYGSSFPTALLDPSAGTGAVSTPLGGSGAAHSNIQPSIGVNFIIKT